MSDGAPPLVLEEVRGPSAVGGGRRRFFDLLLLVSVTEFKKSFYGTALGYVWSLVRPLLTFAVLLVVFTKIIRLGSEVEFYPVLLLFNVVVFGFFQEATGAAVNSVLAQEGIVRKTQFPRLVIPMASVLVAFFTLTLNLIVVVIFLLAYGVPAMWTWLLFPVILALMIVLTSGISLMLSALNVRFRDVAIIWSVISMVLLYGTPVIYPFEIVPPGLIHDVLAINPLTLIFAQAHVWIIDPNAEGALAVAGGWWQMLPAAAIFVTTCVGGAWVFRREAPRIAELL